MSPSKLKRKSAPSCRLWQASEQTHHRLPSQTDPRSNRRSLTELLRTPQPQSTQRSHKKLQGLTKKLSDSHWQGACACNRSALPQMTPHNAPRGGCSLQRLVRRLPPEPIAFVIPGTHVSSLKHVQRPKTTRIDSRRQGGVRSLAARRAGLSRRANPNSPQSDRPKNTDTQNA